MYRTHKTYKGSFLLRAWNGAFFVCFIDFFTFFWAQGLREVKNITKRNKEYCGAKCLQLGKTFNKKQRTNAIENVFTKTLTFRELTFLVVKAKPIFLLKQNLKLQV